MEWEVNSPLRRSGRSPRAPTSNHSDLLIVGAGVFGTSTLYHLVQSKTCPTSITILDRTPYPPQHAASTDINKIIRADYSSPFWMDIASEALHAWKTWPELRPYYHRTGWINFHSATNDIPKRIRENYRKRGRDPTKTVSLDEAKQSYEGIFSETVFEGHDIDSAYTNPEAGWCDAGAATAKLLDEALRLGGDKVRYKTGDVRELLLSSDRSRVAGVEMTSGLHYTADRVILATGAWTSSIMSSTEDALRLDEADRMEHQIKAAGVCVAHYKLDEEDMQMLKKMPVIIYGELGDCQPAPSKSRLLKYTNAWTFTNTVTSPSGHKYTVPPTLTQQEMPTALKQETHDRLTSKLLPRFTKNRPVAYWRQCWDAVSPTQDHLLARHPKLENLFIASGGSLHSYKFLPTVGKYMVNVLEGKSNGEERDEHWGWKTGVGSQIGKGAHRHAVPTREYRDLCGGYAARL